MQERARANFSYIIISVLLVISLLAFGYQLQEKDRYKQLLDNAYRSSLYKVADNVSNVAQTLEAIQLARATEQNFAMFARAWEQSKAAHETLAALAYNDETISGALGYLNEVSNVCYAMMKKGVHKEQLLTEEWQALSRLEGEAKQLSAALNTALAEVSLARNISWDRLASENGVAKQEYKGRGLAAKPLLGSISSVSNAFITDEKTYREQEALLDETYIDEQTAFQLVLNILMGYDIDTIVFIESYGYEPIPCYSYEVRLKNQTEPTIWLKLSRHDGRLISLIENTTGTQIEPLTLDTAMNAATKFLSINGFENMHCFLYNAFDDEVYFNFAPLENGVLLYPDQVVLKVSLNSGSISFSAKDYVKNHRERGLNQPKLSQNEVMELVSNQLDVKNVRLALIENEYGNEVLCYEVEGIFNGTSRYFIYLNGDNGGVELVE